jgi:phosphoribosyl-ATP pyrophosphohydrolase
MASRTKKPKRKSSARSKPGSPKRKALRSRKAKAQSDPKPAPAPSPPVSRDPVKAQERPGEERIDRLSHAIQDVRAGARTSARTTKLLAGGTPKMAQKVIEEAAEVGIEAIRGDRTALVNESADLIYNLVVLWTEHGIAPDDVWQEMDRREGLLGLAEKLPKAE